MTQWVDQAVMALLDKLLKDLGRHHSHAVSTELMGCFGGPSPEAEVRFQSPLAQGQQGVQGYIHPPPDPRLVNPQMSMNDSDGYGPGRQQSGFSLLHPTSWFGNRQQAQPGVLICGLEKMSTGEVGKERVG